MSAASLNGHGSVCDGDVISAWPFCVIMVPASALQGRLWVHVPLSLGLHKRRLSLQMHISCFSLVPWFFNHLRAATQRRGHRRDPLPANHLLPCAMLVVCQIQAPVSVSIFLVTKSHREARSGGRMWPPTASWCTASPTGAVLICSCTKFDCWRERTGPNRSCRSPSKRRPTEPTNHRGPP